LAFFKKALSLYQPNAHYVPGTGFMSKTTHPSNFPAQLCNFLAMAYGQLGAARRSITLHYQAYRLDHTLLEAQLNAGQMHKELGSWQQALQIFTSLLDILNNSAILLTDKKREQLLFTTWAYRGTLLYGLGKVVAAEADFRACLKLRVDTNPHNSGATLLEKAHLRYPDNAAMLSMCLQAQGKYAEALLWIDIALRAAPSHWSRHLKSVVEYWRHSLDIPIQELNIDNVVSPICKEFLCMKGDLNANDISAARFVTIDNEPAKAAPADVGSELLTNILSNQTSKATNAHKEAAKLDLQQTAERLQQLALRYLPYIQLKCSGKFNASSFFV
jgi:tetratricopeptide (TPR) repeat protein